MKNLRDRIDRYKGPLDAAWLAGLSAILLAIADNNFWTWLAGLSLTLHGQDLLYWIMRGRSAFQHRI